MIHLFILFPLLIIFGVLIVQLARRHPENVTFRYFRNFILIWSACTVAVGAAETFSGKAPVVFTTLSFVLPFLYIASFYLVRIPFAITQKEGSLSNFLSVATVALGIFYGLSLFLMVQNLQASAGPLSGLFSHMSANFSTHHTLALPRVLIYHALAILAIFVPVGLFFLSEAIREREARNRLRSALIGVGLIVAGAAEWYHVAGLHAANRDFILVFGFLLVVVGLLYPAWRPTLRPAA